MGQAIDVKLAEVLSVKDYGAVGNGVADDTTSIASALSGIVASGKPTRLLFPQGTYKITSGLTVDASYVSIDAYGSTIDATGLATGSAIRVLGSRDPSYANICCEISGINIVGPGMGSGVNGIELRGADSSHAAANVTISNCYVSEFQSGVMVEDNGYILSMVNCNIRHCDDGFYVPNGSGNHGERLVIMGGSIIQCTDLIHLSTNTSSSPELFVFGCSLDHCYAKVANIVSSKCSLFGCHIEAKDWADTPLVVSGDGAVLKFYGGSIGTTFSPSGNNLTCDYLVDCASTATGGGVFIDSVKFHNCRTQTGHIATGDGYVQITNSSGFNSWLCNKVVGLPANHVRDGGFELASIVDNIFISGDTAAITSRTNGTTIDLDLSTAQHNSGSKSLHVATGAGGGKFTVAVPIAAGVIGNYELYYAKPGSETGSVTIKDYYGILDRNASGIPTILTRSDALQSRSLNFTSAATAWTLTNGIHTVKRAPAWATHYIIEFDLTSFSNAHLYVDDLIVSVM